MFLFRLLLFNSALLLLLLPTAFLTVLSAKHCRTTELRYDFNIHSLFLTEKAKSVYNCLIYFDSKIAATDNTSNGD